MTICLYKSLTPGTRAKYRAARVLMRPDLISKLRALEIARRRTEEERAEALFLCERRRRIQSAMREQLERKESHEQRSSGPSECTD
jgi:hypothetical protein